MPNTDPLGFLILCKASWLALKGKALMLVSRIYLGQGLKVPEPLPEEALTKMKEVVLFKAQGHCYSSSTCCLLISRAMHNIPEVSWFTEMVQVEILSGEGSGRETDIISTPKYIWNARAEGLNQWVKQEHQLTMKPWGRECGDREGESSRSPWRKH